MAETVVSRLPSAAGGVRCPGRFALTHLVVEEAMQMRCTVVGMLALVFVAGQLRAADNPQKDAPEMKFKYLSVVIDGKEVPKDQLKDMLLVVKGNKGVVKKGKEVLFEGTSKVDMDKTPWTIDMKVTAGKEKGKSYKGIMEFADGKLKVCWGKPDGDRPKKFSSTKGSGNVLEVLEEMK
jgi:uncharacterized protein (TIGR03067 family)